MSDRRPDLLASARALDALLRVGEGASRPVVGEEARQAVASLRGYAYQIFASALAWLDLPPGAELHLEVAEDYAVAVRDSLNATQVKELSSTVSLATEPVRAAIASFVKLVKLNPSRMVRLTFLTTAKVTTEQRKDHRTGDVAGIQRWQEAGEGGEIGDLRRVLLALDLGEDTHRYIRDRDDERLRKDLLQRIEWRCGEASQEELDLRLRERVAALCLDEFDVPPIEGELLTPHVLQAVLRACSQAGLRTLTHRQLRGLLRGVTSIGMDRRVHNIMSAAVAGLLAATAGSLSAPRSWSAEADVPLPSLLIQRPAVVACAKDGLTKDRAVVVYGGTGMGKTAVARLVARGAGGVWNLLELRTKGVDEAGERLLAYSSRPHDGSTGVIADDVPDLHLADQNSGLIRAMRMLADRGELALITSARPPTTRGRALLGISEASVVAIPLLSGQELVFLIDEAGGDGGWATPLQIASRGGHPQLANALVTGLRGRGWPEAERSGLALLNAAEIEEESEATRARLVRAVPDEATRILLHRVSIVADRFPREIAVALGGVQPPLSLPGDSFNSLVGPWIDRVSSDRYRISPLIAGAGRHALGRSEIASVHKAIAECLTSEREILADQVDNIFIHALEARTDEPLLLVAGLIITSSDLEVRRLQPHALHLMAAKVEQPIASWNPILSVTLRLAQMLLLSARDFGAVATHSARALIQEIGGLEVTAKEQFEALALSKLLFRSGMSRSLPDWPALLARFLEVTVDMPESGNAEITEAIGGRDIGPVLFAFGISQLGSVAQLADGFERLSLMDAPTRDRMLSPMDAVWAPTVQALSPWVRERKGGAGGAEAALSLYRRMAELAASWGQRDWAIAFQVAVAELCDQELRNFDVALKGLQAAHEILGDDRWLMRAEQKIHFHNRDDKVVVVLVDRLSGAFADTDIEASHMLREGAISAGRIGEHSRAAAWFGEADGLASRVGLPKMDAMAVGLAADAAVELWRSGQRSEALAAMAAVLDRLAQVDPGANLQCGYVHRLVRHSLLWFAHASGMQAMMEDGSAPTLPPGACSNPDPVEAVLNLPLTDLDIAWYLLAQVAMVAGLPGAVPEPGARINGGPVIEMEILLRRHRLDRAIVIADPDAFVALLPEAFDAVLAARAAMERTAQGLPHEWRRGEVPRADSADPAGARFVSAAILAFRVVAAALGRAEAVDRLHKLLAASPALIASETLAAVFPRGSLPPPGARPPEACARLVGRNDLSPAELLECCLRLAMRFENSDFLRSVESPFVKWAKGMWLQIATQRLFSLSNPRYSAPAIAEAARAEGENLQCLATVMEAALPGVAMRLPAELAGWIRSTVRA